MGLLNISNLETRMRKAISKYPPYPDSNWDYAVRHTASTKLIKGNKGICIYCHCQAKTEEGIIHKSDCPTLPKKI